MKLDRSVALFAVFASGSALAAGGECKTDQDCGAGEFCAATPCMPPECDPNDPSCEMPECPSFCLESGATDGGEGGGGTSMDGCQSDADCAAGMECGVIGSTGTACACPEGAPDCGCDEQADPIEYKGCMPKACSTDADCGGDLECVSFSRPCATPAMACAEGQECPEPEPCDETTISQCLPKWVGACEADADCGEGFTCKAYETCACSGGSSGSSGGASAGGGSDEPAPPPARDGDAGAPEEATDAPPDNCTCAPSAEKYCEPVKQNCSTDSECPTDWKCESFQTMDGGTSSNGTSTEPACPEGQSCADSAGQGEAAAPVAPPSEAWCVPPYYTDLADAGALPTSGPMADGEAFPSRDGSGGSDGSNNNGTPEGTDGTTGVPKGSTGSSSSASAGCTIDGKGSPASLAAIGFALLALVGLRRRA